MAISDIILIAVVALFGVFGALRSFKKSALSLGAFLVAFLFAFFLAKVIAEAFLGIASIRSFVIGSDGWSLYTWIYDGYQPSAVSDFNKSMFYDPVAELASHYNGYTANFTQAQGEALCMAFTMFSAFVGVGLFLIVRLLLMIVTAIIKSFIGKQKRVSGRLFGMITSMVEGLIVTMSVLIVLSTMGGLTFFGTFQTIEDDIQKAVLAKPFNEWSYSIRNSMFLPSDAMFARIVGASGLTVDEKEPDRTTEMEQTQLDLYVDFYNLNYENGSPYRVGEGTTLVVPEDKTAGAIDPTKYNDSGFDVVIKYVIDYNTAAAEKMKSVKLDAAKYTNYSTTLGSIYNIWRGNNGMVDPLITLVGNYETKIDNNQHLTSEELIRETNAQLTSQYTVLVEQFARLKEKYASLEADFGEFNLPIPTAAYQLQVPAEA